MKQFPHHHRALTQAPRGRTGPPQTPGDTITPSRAWGDAELAPAPAGPTGQHLAGACHAALAAGVTQGHEVGWPRVKPAMPGDIAVTLPARAGDGDGCTPENSVPRQGDLGTGGSRQHQ